MTLALWKCCLHCCGGFKQIKLDYNKLLTYCEAAKEQPENCFNFAFVCVYDKNEINKLHIKIMSISCTLKCKIELLRSAERAIGQINKRIRSRRKRKYNINHLRRHSTFQSLRHQNKMKYLFEVAKQTYNTFQIDKLVQKWIKKCRNATKCNLK